MRRLAAVLSVAALGCVTGTTEHFDLENSGRTCAFATDPNTLETVPQTFAAGQPITFRATLDDCLSACSLNVQATCDVVRSGSAIHITSQGSWSERHAPGLACVDSCLELTSTCITRPLEAGTYTVDYAGATTTITVPSSVPAAPCVAKPQ